MAENTEAKPKQEMSLLEILNLHGLPPEHKAMRQLTVLSNIIEDLANIAGGGTNRGFPIPVKLLTADEIIHGVKKRDMSRPGAEQSPDTAGKAAAAPEKIMRQVPQYEADWPRGLNQGPPSIIGDQVVFKSSLNGAPLAMFINEIKLVTPDVDNYNGKDQNRFSIVYDSKGQPFPVEHPLMVILNLLAEY